MSTIETLKISMFNLMRLLIIALVLLRPGSAQAEDKLVSLGSGFFIAPNRILTNFHVVRNCMYFKAAHQDEDWFDAKLIFGDSAMDLALIETVLQSQNQAVFEENLEMIDAHNLAVVGFPNLGRPSIRPVHYTVAAPEGVKTNGDAFTVMGEFHPGNSGSPVLASNGTVVGIIARGFDTIVGYQRTGKLIDDGGEAISNAAIMRFLNVHHVPFVMKGNMPSMATDDLFTAAKSIVVQIGCWSQGS